MISKVTQQIQELEKKFCEMNNALKEEKPFFTKIKLDP